MSLFISKNRGFTLVEIMVAVIIVAVLVSIVLANISEARKKARDSQRMSDLEQIRLALRLYADVNGGYPKESEIGTHLGFFDGVIGASAYDPDRLIQPYVTAPIKDPLHNGTEYFYYYDGFHQCTKEVNDAPSGELNIVLIANKMEQTSNANWSTVCDETDSEPGVNPPDAGSYILLLPGLQTS